jgi:hypothetical protein
MLMSQCLLFYLNQSLWLNIDCYLLLTHSMEFETDVTTFPIMTDNCGLTATPIFEYLTNLSSSFYSSHQSQYFSCSHLFHLCFSARHLCFEL